MIEERTKEHSFTIKFTEAESKRLETFVRESGMKKLAVARKAILRYLDEEEQKAGN